MDPVHKVGILVSICSMVVMAVGQALKTPMAGQVLKSISSRWRWLVIFGIAIVVGVCGSFAGDLNTVETIIVTLFSFAGGIANHEVVVSGVLGVKTGDKK